jgi:uncharacterized membrane protein YhiD involved in acid resistance
VCGLGPGRSAFGHGGRAAVATQFLAAFVPQLNWSETLLWIVLAAVFGGAIGVERGFRECEAGPHTHTHLLVSVGAAASRSRPPTGSTTSWSRTAAASSVPT